MPTILNADTVTGGAVITGDASGQLALQAAGVTKLTVSSAGVSIPTLVGSNINLATNVTGTLPAANGGTGITSPGAAGNVLISNGTAWTSAATGYPTRSFVASGALSNGDVVVLNTDGTVSIVSGTVPAVGAVVTYPYGMEVNNDGCYDPTTNKVVVVFRSNNYSYGVLTASSLVGTVSGTTITWGAQENFSGFIIGNDAISFCSLGNGKVAVTYTYNDGNISSQVRVGTISGTSINWGPVFSPGIANVTGMRVRYDAGNDNVVVLTASSGAQQVYLQTFTYSGTTLTQKGGVVILAATTSPVTTSSMLNMVYDSSVARMIIMYSDRTNNGYGTAQVVNCQPSSPVVGAKTVFNSAATNYISGCFDPVNNKSVICYQNSTGYGTAIVGTATSTAISFGTAQTFNSASTLYIGAVYCSFQKRIAIIWQGFSISASLSGTTLSFQSPVVSTNNMGGAVAYDSTSYKVAFAGYGASQVFEPGYTTVTNWVGVATNSALNGASVNVAMQGSVVTNQTGLTTGTTYYLTSTGALTTSSSATGYKLGKALSATSLLITEGNAA